MLFSSQIQMIGLRRPDRAEEPLEQLMTALIILRNTARGGQTKWYRAPVFWVSKGNKNRDTSQKSANVVVTKSRIV